MFFEQFLFVTLADLQEAFLIKRNLGDRALHMIPEILAFTNNLEIIGRIGELILDDDVFGSQVVEPWVCRIEEVVVVRCLL